MNIWELLLAIGLPSAALSAVFGYFIHRIERRQDKLDKEQNQREERRENLELLQIKGTLSAMALGEATAKALKNGHCNGETEKALEYEETVKHEIRDYMTEQGIKHIIDD